METTHTFAAFSVLLQRGLREVHKDEQKRFPQVFERYIRTKTRTYWTETDMMISGLGIAQKKPIGESFQRDVVVKGPTKTFELTPYGLAVSINYELLRWDKYEVIGRIARQLAKSLDYRKNLLGHSIWNEAFTATDVVYLTHRGKTLCATDHPRLGGGTSANKPAVATGITYLGIEQGQVEFALFTDERGLFSVLSPSMLICHPSKRSEANVVLRSELRPGTADNDKNVLEDSWGRLNLSDSPFLQSTTAWFLTAMKDDLAMCFAKGDDNIARTAFEPKTLSQHHSVYGSYGIELFDWVGVWGTEGV